jgi:ABC-type uncharacterized transport system permease subunit
MPILLGLSVMLPALFGTVLVHHPNALTQPASLIGLGMGMFTLVGALQGARPVLPAADMVAESVRSHSA